MSSPPDNTDADVARRIAAGDEAAFDRLYGENVERVYAVCLRMAGDAAQARALTQESFVRAWQRMGSFRGDSRLSSWLHRIAVNVVLMHIRKKNNRITEAPLETESPNDESPVPEYGAEDGRLSGSIERVNLESAIDKLSPGYRIIFVLHDVEGYEHNEIAEMLDCSVGTSKSQLHKARMKLRDILRPGIVRRMPPRPAQDYRMAA